MIASETLSNILRREHHALMLAGHKTAAYVVDGWADRAEALETAKDEADGLREEVEKARSRAEVLSTRAANAEDRVKALEAFGF